MLYNPIMTKKNCIWDNQIEEEESKARHIPFQQCYQSYINPWACFEEDIHIYISILYKWLILGLVWIWEEYACSSMWVSLGFTLKVKNIWIIVPQYSTNGHDPHHYRTKLNNCLIISLSLSLSLKITDCIMGTVRTTMSPKYMVDLKEHSKKSVYGKNLKTS